MTKDRTVKRSLGRTVGRVDGQVGGISDGRAVGPSLDRGHHGPGLRGRGGPHLFLFFLFADDGDDDDVICFLFFNLFHLICAFIAKASSHFSNRICDYSHGPRLSYYTTVRSIRVYTHNITAEVTALLSLPIDRCRSVD